MPFLLILLSLSLELLGNRSPHDTRHSHKFFKDNLRSTELFDIKQPVIYVSLGSHCQVASQLNYYGLRNGAFPLDWVLSGSIDAVIDLINNDFRNFFEEDLLFIHPNTFWWIENPIYQFEFRHEWPFDDSIPSAEKISQMITEAKLRYNRRIDRFRMLRKCTGKVVFIRTASNLDQDSYWNKQEEFRVISPIQSIKLNKALRNFFPNLNFDLIIINYSNSRDTSIIEIDENIFEFKVASLNTFAYEEYDHVFGFLKDRIHS